MSSWSTPRVRSHRARFTGALCLLVGLAGVVGVAGCGDDGVADATAGPEPLAPDSISIGDLEPCKDPSLPPKLRCGTIDLPYERAEPSLGEIPIAFAVLPRKDRESPSKGAIIAIEGGPGYGSIGSVKGYSATFGGLLNERELVLVDARGTGRSKPLDCPDMQTGIARNEIGLAACAAQLGETYDSYRTSAIADDINDVRAALGYDEVQVYGDSYGTFLAQSYAFRHGETLEALVLDSAYPARGESGWYPSTWRTGIRGVAIACERSAECEGDAARRLERFVVELRDRKLDVGPFLDRLANAGFVPPTDNYLRIDRVIVAFLDGDDEPYEELTRLGAVGGSDASGYSYGQELVVSCNDYSMIWDKSASEPERREQLQAAIDAYPRNAFEPFTPREIALAPDWGYLECLAAPQPNEFYEPPAEEDAPAPEAPVLVIAGELDNVTTPAQGRAAAELFPNSTLFVWRNAGHVQALYDPQSKGAVKLRKFFLRNQGLPE